MHRLTLVAAVLVPTLASAQNLVTNGGFETGDFSGFTYAGGPNAAGSVLVVKDDNFTPPVAHSGAYALEIFTPLNAPWTLTQFIATTPGTAYAFSFWAKAPTIAGPAFLDFGGVRVTANSPNLTPTYSLFSGVAVATSTSTALVLSGFNDPSVTVVDDLSVSALATTAPEPATFALLGIGLAGAGLVARRRRGT